MVDAVIRVWEEEASQARNQKLYNKVMVLHCVLASPEEMEAMAVPNGWRRLLPINMSQEMQICILQGRIDAMIPGPFTGLCPLHCRHF
jgi:hypothetical protein